MSFELTREQRSLVNFFAFAEGCGSLNHSQLGTGKTAQGVALAETLAAESTLIVGPLHVLSGWERHVEMIAGQEVRFIDSKKAGKLALKDLLLNKPGYYFIGRERFRLSDWSNICTDMLLFDESHAAQNKDSRMFQAMGSTKHVGYKHFLSATPFGSTFAGAWSVGALLWPEWMQENGWMKNPKNHNRGGFWAWAQEFATGPGLDIMVDGQRKRWTPKLAYPDKVDDKEFMQAQSTRAHFAGQAVDGELVPGRWLSMLPCAGGLESTMTTGVVREDIRVTLHPVQKKAYQQMEQDALMWLDENPLEAQLPITQRIRLRQATLGELDIETGPDGEDVVTFKRKGKSAKYDALKSLLGDLIGEKVLVLTDSAKFAMEVADRLAEEKVGWALPWTGASSKQERDYMLREFSEGELRYLVATQASIGEGVDGLQNRCHIMVVLSESDQILLNEQAVGRLQRRGQTKQVVAYRVVADGTIDDKQADTLLNRELAMRGSLMVSV